MFERYTLSCTYFPSQAFDETGCDYLIFPTPDTLLSTSTTRWKTERESTPKRSIYSTSRSGTTLQVGIQSSNSLIKSTQKLLVRASTSTLKPSTLIRLQIPTFLHLTFTPSQVTSSHATYTTTLTTQITSAIIESKNDKSL